MKVIFSEDADEDLDSIVLHISIDNPVRAISFVNEIIDHCLTLQDNPRAYQLVQDVFLPDGSTVRRMPHHHYNVYYTANEERVLILNVRNAAKTSPF